MEIKAYIRTIMRYWFVVVLVTLVSGATAAFLVSVKRPVYSANARVATRPAAVLSDTRTIVDLLGQMTARSVTGTFAQAFTSSDVKAAARQVVGLSEEDATDYPLEANILPNSLVLEVSGTGPDPGMLVNYINATVDATVQRASTLFRVVDLVPLDPAHFPQAPTSPLPSRDIPSRHSARPPLGHHACAHHRLFPHPKSRQQPARPPHHSCPARAARCVIIKRQDAKTPR